MFLHSATLCNILPKFCFYYKQKLSFTTEPSQLWGSHLTALISHHPRENLQLLAGGISFTAPANDASYFHQTNDDFNDDQDDDDPL